MGELGTKPGSVVGRTEGYDAKTCDVGSTRGSELASEAAGVEVDDSATGA